MFLTPDQEAALAAPGPRVAVTAGAGSGKTTLLVEAIWRDLEHRGLDLDEILVATYNRAAAEHLRARAQARFADPEDGRPADRAGLDLSAAWIGTFHALCARIVREQPFAAGVDPGFTELDGTEAAALLDAALDAAIEATEHPGLLELLACAWSPEPVRVAARAAHERLRAAGHDVPRILVPPAPPADPALPERIRQAASAVTAHPRARGEHAAAAADAIRMADHLALPEALPKASRNCVASLKPLCTALNDAVALLAGELADTDARHQLLGFAELMERLADAYAARKRELGALDYEDLLLAARRVLRGAHPYRFRVAYVDEYQDANAVQDEIVTRLGARRTVVVGDACQAIYGFRHAEPGVFLARAATSERRELRQNFRSQEPLLAHLNGWLGAALAAEPAFAPLRPGAPARAEAPALAEPPVELVDVAVAGGAGGGMRNAPDEPRARTGRAEEAEVVADVVAGLVARGYAHRDIAVLFRALTQVHGYEAALRARGIPTHVVAGRGFFAHEQVADALALLRLVENPWEEPALVRVLASPYLAASDEDLVRLRAQAGPDRPLWPAVAAVPALAPLAAIVAGLRAGRRASGLAGLVEAAVGANGYDLAALGDDDGPRRFANLRKLVRMAASFAAVRGEDLAGFLRLVDAQAKEPAQDPGEATLVDPSLDAVRLSTVHGVKGQEFPAVVLADASHGRGGHPPIVLVDQDGRAAIRLQRHGTATSLTALGYTDLDARARAEATAEERRIAYVALTRAERHVSVVGRAERNGGGDDTAYSILAPGAIAAGIARSVAVARAPSVAPVAPPAPPVPTAAAVPPLPPPPAPGPAAAGRRLSFSALATHATCSLRFQLEHEQGLRGVSDIPVPAPPGVPALGPWGGAAVGSLVHARLERHAWGGPPPALGWAASAAEAAGLPPSAAEADRAERLLARLLASPLAARIATGTPVRERPFALRAGGALLTGFVDLAVALPDGTRLLCDWKTHRLDATRTPAALMTAYRLQQALYGLAALRAGDRAVELAWVFLEAPGDLPTRRVTPSDRPALEAEVAEALGTLDAPPRPAATTPQPFCAGCPGLRAVCPVARSAAGA